MSAAFRVSEIRLDSMEKVHSVVCFASDATTEYIVYLLGDDVSQHLSENRHKITLPRGRLVLLHMYCGKVPGSAPEYEHSTVIYNSGLCMVADQINEGEW